VVLIVAAFYAAVQYFQDGMILENDNDLDPACNEPHYDVITSPDQVQIYEPVMGNTRGESITTLLLAAQYLKDTRLLPADFDKTTAPANFAQLQPLPRRSILHCIPFFPQPGESTSGTLRPRKEANDERSHDELAVDDR
jgi:hypothetical protein